MLKYSKIKLLLQKRGIYIAAGLIVVWTLFPLYWLLKTSLIPLSKVISMPPSYIPFPASLTKYLEVFQGTLFGQYWLNSAIVASSATLLCLAITCFAAYAFARLHFPGKMPLLFSILVTMMLPPMSYIFPLFQFAKRVGLIDTKIILVVLYSNLGIPMGVWFLFLFFRQIPTELEDAAKVDGCSPPRILFSIILPLSLPGLISVGTLLFIWFWAEFLLALTFTVSESAKTVPVFLQEVPAPHTTDWPKIATVGVLIIIPIVVIVSLLEKYIVAGLTQGAIKG